MNKFFRQLLFMCKKNATLQIRYWKSTVTQAVLGPIVVLIILFGIQTSVSFLQEKLVLNPPPYDLGPMPICSVGYIFRSINIIRKAYISFVEALHLDDVCTGIGPKGPGHHEGLHCAEQLEDLTSTER